MSKSLLSIDIGIKNLGWSYILYDPKKNETNLSISFDIYTIDEEHKKGKESTVVYRCRRINEFFEQFEEGEIEDIVIERQVNTNTQAMSIMYALVMKAFEILPKEHIHIFDPKLKFTFYNETYSTKNKEHKKKSIDKAHTLLTLYYTDQLEKFNSFPKKDDISDAINQGITFLKMNKMIQ